jgi:DNA (cytosine-5)-methyltransferase 1
MSIPVIDLFAGPGGLGEGFSRQTAADFHIAISIEKDEMAHETLRLRAAHRALSRCGKADKATWATWDSLVASEPWNVLFYRLRDCGNKLIAAACRDAEHEALNLELGPGNRDEATSEIRERLKPWMQNGRLPENAVLIGGPPCQAYSVVGRSRNRGIVGYTAEGDHRHFLYLEYLNVIAEFRPAVFVMENVKGILSSRVQERQIFDTIREDLRRPDIAAGKGKPVEYVLLPLPRSMDLPDEPLPDDYIVCAEDYGVPQARHRVIILGIRKDVYEQAGAVPRLTPSAPPTVLDMINDLPLLRPQISRRGKDLEPEQALDDPSLDKAVDSLLRGGNPAMAKIAEMMMEVREQVRNPRKAPSSGTDRTLRSASDLRGPAKLRHWLRDRECGLLSNHVSRSHMPSDLVRYLFVAAYGQVTGQSPHLVDFPVSLLPEHKNVDRERVGDSIFKDRFRVQLGNRHSMTVTSHIAKDGHAFIHPRPGQFRSLTVREAARLQTFPDSYVFLGNRTSQYTQVGNAVPPYLAFQIAGVVAAVLKAAQRA